MYKIKRYSHSRRANYRLIAALAIITSLAVILVVTTLNIKAVWIIDGDGALLMHLGAMATLGVNSPNNVVHIVINNGAHETVGGMPTVAEKIDVVKIAEGCGYKNAVSVSSFDALDEELEKAKLKNELSLIEVKCSIGARDDLGRPTTTAMENKINFMKNLATK